LKTLVLGMGNPILSDDGIGLHVARALAGKFPGVEVATTAMVGLDVLEIIEGYDRLFLIDALTTRDNRPGTLHRLTVEDGTLHLFSSHGVNFFELLSLGRELGCKMPEVAGIYGIEIGDDVAFGGELTERLERMADGVAEDICSDILNVLSRQ